MEAPTKHDEEFAVGSLGELRRATALTQSDVAREWGRSQSRVSSFEATDLANVEIGTLVEYVRALHGELEIRITASGYVFRERLS